MVLNNADKPLCNVRMMSLRVIVNEQRIHITPLALIGGATARLKNDIIREMDSNSCHHCKCIALGMLALYASRDTGKPW